MTELVRRGGRGTLPDGATLTWSVAEGTRGRRWRATLVRDGALEHSLLLETDTEGRPVRLELDTRDGLLTLHPAADRGEIHGNVVTHAGIRHLAFEWSADHDLLVAGQPLTAVAAAHRLAPAVAVGATVRRQAVVVDRALGVRSGPVRVEQPAAAGWHLTGEGLDDDCRIDAHGLPAGLADEAVWSLED